MSEFLSTKTRFLFTFRALRHRNYRLFFFGQLVSYIGTWMQRIALQWLVYRLTGSATMMGVIELVVVLPQGPLSLWGGSLADRFSKRSLMLVTQSTMMLLAFSLAALTWTGKIQMWHVLVAALGVGIASAIDVPVTQSFWIELVDDKDDLANALGLSLAIFNAARVIGPAIGGSVVAMAGEAAAFFFNGLSFPAILISLLMMRLADKPPPMHKSKFGPHLWEAMRYLWRQPTMIVLFSLVAMSAFLSVPYLTLLPVFAKKVLQESAQPLIGLVCHGLHTWLTCQSPDAITYGLLVAAPGIGALGGALFAASQPPAARRGWWLTVCNLGFPALLIGLALSRSFVFTLVLLVGIGFSFAIQDVLASIMLQLTVPDEMRGQVLSLYMVGVIGMMRLGGVQAGLLGDYLGAPAAVGIGALICLIYSVFIVWRYPRLRELA